MACSDRWQVQTECRARQVSERAGEVVETLGLSDNGGDSDGRLEGVGEGDGGDEGGEEGAGEGGGMQKGGEDGHCCGGKERVKITMEGIEVAGMKAWECLLYVQSRHRSD